MKTYHTISFFSLFFLIFLFQHTSVSGQEAEAGANKIIQVLKNIDNFYVDETDESELVDEAIVQLLTRLDPHSEYFTKEEAEELMRNLDGSFEGVGITYSLLRDTIFILSTVTGGPADLAGMQAGDRIIRIDDKPVAGVDISDDEIRKMLLGEKGTKVKLAVKRNGRKKFILMQLTRDEIQPGSISAAYMLNDNVAYIKLERFSLHADNEFEDSLSSLKKQGAEHLIFDLRGNSGGYLRTCLNIADAFWRSREVIVATRGANLDERIYETTLLSSFPNGRLAVLIDESSASASEIIAGAVQDLDRGIIMGRRSYGKGLVQRPFYLNDGSLMRLTIARYYTASGRCIQKSYENGKTAYEKESSQRMRNEPPVDTGEVFYTKNGRKVYAEGAVYPDLYIPSDNDKYSETYKNYLRTGNVFDLVHLFTDKYRVALTGLYEFDSYKNNYDLDELFLSDLYNNLPDSLMPDSGQPEFNATDKIHLKAMIAGDLWGRHYYHVYLNEHSTLVNMALGILNDEKKYRKILSEDFNPKDEHALQY
jgi:carboxyl-terminal processing protease